MVASRSRHVHAWALSVDALPPSPHGAWPTHRACITVHRFKLSNDPEFVLKLKDIVGLYVDNARLIQLAKDIRAARARGEETGLTDEEIAFYDALAENESARPSRRYLAKP